MSLPHPAIDIRHLTKIYPGKKSPALDDLTLSFAAGRVHALLGANGAGKSSLIRILTTVALPSSGTASVLGHDVAADGIGVRSVIGWVGQQASVDEALHGRTNLIMFGRLHGLSAHQAAERANELLAQYDLTEVAARPYLGYRPCVSCRRGVVIDLVPDFRPLTARAYRRIGR